MSARIKRNVPLLRALYHATPQKRKDILGHCSPDFLKTLCEIALNILKGNIKLSPSQHRKLNKQKKIIRLLADKRAGLKRKQTALRNQRGGFILPILAALAPLIGNLVGGIINK